MKVYTVRANLDDHKARGVGLYQEDGTILGGFIMKGPRRYVLIVSRIHHKDGSIIWHKMEGGGA